MLPYRDTVLDWPMGTISALFTLIAVVLVGGLVLYTVFVVVDSWNIPTTQGVGYVEKKVFEPAHTEMVYIYNAATKTSLPQPIFHDDEYKLDIKVGDETTTAIVERGVWATVSKGDRVSVECGRGRITSLLYITNVHQ